MSKKIKRKVECPQCDAVYTFAYDPEENTEDPLFCCFCGEEIPEDIERVRFH